MTTTKYYNFNGFNDKTGDFETNKYVIVNNETGRYVEVGNGAGPSATKSVDFQGKYLMPGLINAHIHVDSDVYNEFGKPNFGVNNEQEHVRAVMAAAHNMKNMLHHGVTVVRNVGTSWMTDIEMARLQREGSIEGPMMVASGAAFSMTGGHGSGGGGIEVDGPDEVRKSVRQAMKSGAQIIKFMVTGGVSAGDFENPDQVQLNEDEVHAGVIEAHKKGIKVAAHAQGTEGIKIAVRAGVDSVEHAFHLDDEAVELMKEHGTSVVPTMIAMKRIIDRPNEVPSWMIERATTHWEAHQKSVAKAAASGVNMVMGTDSGTPFNGFGDESAVEMDMMVEFGKMTPQNVLQSATINAANMMAIEQDYGSISVGKFADFIVMQENPAENMKALQQDNKFVFQHGHAVVFEES
ncbi:amidohydrolase family protein [Leuconostoc falkenbergense]|jgi:imidazolonepropionase-like amidohydrolase|uniref:Amidohydrolase family protein n=2 Tax=Leuconostoc falkenbergense TaxID=2766470 RepID=A0A9X3INA1_9LACO|nr:amidohydrolase family protein [Leuconostoc falkenbergense]RDG18166.1 amidohydrolase family protein [Leuconostoc pseudomesenteroides]MCT4389441.1 amidohydrolase family protein [Leuconostoc falkenbergense]MCT4411520.1 amidohydrolase family protein [Leuconostoc falkenbergense]MCX7577838.1 amidohydrolase family protein [Leuconostoc falkenbergense]MDM7646471.1 amidohydrolase family protein [Leuconostoc falkenbergense]